MVLKSVIFAFAFVNVVAFSQSVDVHLWAANTCDGTGASVIGLEQGTCASSFDPTFGSIVALVEGVSVFFAMSTDTWRDVADGTKVIGGGLKGGDPCGTQIASFNENECEDAGEWGDVFTGAFFINGQGEPAPIKRDSEIRNCSSTMEVNAYIMKKAGVIYSVSARNATHVAALRAAGSSAKRGEYIIANYETKKPAKALKRVTRNN